MRRDIFRRKSVKLAVEPGDEQIPREGQLDYVTFSYYRSAVIDAASHLLRMAAGPEPISGPDAVGCDRPVGLRYVIRTRSTIATRKPSSP
ncbi:MAG: hypothetical protein ACLTSX_11835 [Collinsella sp.]